ncbi:Nup85 nucleoporin-domain-containing protein [Entophlyctis helioformis]|nr:Nup85 nucleoporin-domain-containing protein [Entophlyctis helioformis]
MSSTFGFGRLGQQSSSAAVGAPPVQTSSAGMVRPGAMRDLVALNRTVFGALQPLGKSILLYSAARVPKELLQAGSGGGGAGGGSQAAAAAAAAHQQQFPQDQKVLQDRLQTIPETRLSFFQAALGVFTSACAEHEALASRAAQTVGFGMGMGTRMGTAAKRAALPGSSGLDPNASSRQSLVSRVSSAYQQAIHSHVRSLEGLAADAAGAPEPDTETREETSLFAAIHSVWHLAHILFFDEHYQQPGSSASVLEDLVTWHTLNHAHDIQTEFEAMVGMLSPTEYPGFWPYIHHCLLRGHFVAATSMVRLLSRYKLASDKTHLGLIAGGSAAKPKQTSNPVEALSALVSAMPTATTVESSALFAQQWRQWQDHALYLYADGALSSLHIEPQDKPHFARAFGILAGVESVILESAETWQEALVALGMFAYPQFQASHVKDLLTLITGRFKTDTLLDRTLLALLELDIPKALRYASELDWWLATHLVDLFEKADMLGDIGGDDENGGMVDGTDRSLSEWYRLQFAEYLLAHPSLWRVALEYLVSCPRHGRDMLVQVIPRLPLSSHLKTRKLLAFCDEHGLDNVKRQLHRVLGRSALSGGRQGEALWHYIEAGEDRKVAVVCNQLLQTHLTARTAGSASSDMAGLIAALDAINPALAYQHDRLAFLFRYRDFHKLYAAGQYEAAGDLLAALLTSSATPKMFWRALLLDAIPLLEGELVVFSVSQTLELMRCLEDVIVRQRRERPAATRLGGMDRDGKPKDDEDRALDVMRLALARNMARAMLSP